MQQKIELIKNTIIMKAKIHNSEIHQYIIAKFLLN